MSSSSPSSSFRRGLVPTPLGILHYTAVGGGGGGGGGDDSDAEANASGLLPIVGFHMSPRSVDEYKEIMMLLASSSSSSSSSASSSAISPTSRLFVAIDEFGYGASDNPCRSCSLDEIADCFLKVMDHLQIIHNNNNKWIVAGSLMGCYMALSLASRYPDRIAGVVCSNLYYFFPKEQAREKAALAATADDAAAEEEEEADDDDANNKALPPAAAAAADDDDAQIFDSWILQEDGSHISEIWGKRSGWLSPDLNTRATLDNLQYLVKRRERYCGQGGIGIGGGSRSISIQDGDTFALEETCRNVHCPVLCVNGASAAQFLDAIGMDMSGQFQKALDFFPKTSSSISTSTSSSASSLILPSPQVVVLEPPGSSINMLNENAKEWLDHVTAFAEKIESTI